MLHRYLLKMIGISVCIYINCYSSCFALENAFYVLRGNSPAQISSAENALASLTKHHNDINILISQAYQVNDKGVVWGYIDPAIQDEAAQQHIKIMLLITNAGFSKELAHQFLTNEAAQTSAIQAILSACKKQHLYGVQFDFERVALDDKDALTRFYQSAAEVLHKNGFVVSFAIAPVVSDSLQPSEYLKKVYVNWQGAYDFKKLGAASDFVTIMAYNQHGEGTTPGPTAGLRWVDAVIKYALQYIPPEKISLGIPSYSTYCYTGTDTGHSSGKLMSLSVGIDYNQMIYLLHKYKANLIWDDQDKMNFAIFQHDYLNEYLFAEDEKSFAEKLKLVKKYNLRGISVFDLGSEDPQIWNVLG